MHHLGYERLGNERNDDLLVVCVRCHNDLHWGQRHDSAEGKTIVQFLPVTEQEFVQRIRAEGSSAWENFVRIA